MGTTAPTTATTTSSTLNNSAVQAQNAQMNASGLQAQGASKLFVLVQDHNQLPDPAR